jgi:hypothetical protein
MTISPIAAGNTAAVRTAFGDDAGINWDENVPEHVKPMSADDARALIPRYNGTGMHDLLQWHLSLCTTCNPTGMPGPCPEYFEIISEYADYEGYAIRGQG